MLCSAHPARDVPNDHLPPSSKPMSGPSVGLCPGAWLWPLLDPLLSLGLPSPGPQAQGSLASFIPALLPSCLTGFS